MDLDLVEKGLGVRSRRYAMLVDNGVVCTTAIATWICRACHIDDATRRTTFNMSEQPPRCHPIRYPLPLCANFGR